MYAKRFSLCLMLVILPISLLQAAEPLARKDVVSIQPLVHLYAAIKPDALPLPDVVMPAGRDMHDYRLQLVDIKRIHQASHIFWTGQESEPFLAKLSKKEKDRPEWLLMTAAEHAWLNKTSLLLLIDQMAEHMTGSYPEYAIEIEENVAQLKASLLAYYKQRQSQLTAYAKASVLLGHEAFEAWLDDLGMQEQIHYPVLGHHGHSRLGMRDSLKKRQEIQQADIACVIVEPNVHLDDFPLQNKRLRHIYLDPMLGDVSTVSKTSFVNYYERMADALLNCLQGEQP